MKEENTMAKMLSGQLDALQKTPGAEFSKAAAWEKLHGRLHNKKRSKAMIWFWAAAIVIFLMMIAFFGQQIMPTKKTAPIVKKTEQKQSQPIIQQEQKQVETANNNDAITWHQKNKKLKIKPQSVVPELIIAQPILNIDTAMKKQPDAVVIVPAVAQKKLKVVHNNELSTPVIIPEQTQKASTAFGVRKQVFYEESQIEENKHPVKTKRILPGFNTLVSQKE